MKPVKRSHTILFVAVAAVAVYANSIWNGFAYDDNFIIATNTRVHQLRDLKAIWLTPYWPFFGSQLGLYRPFAIFAFAVEWALGGGAPWLFHLVNVLLNASVSVLVFLLVEKLFTYRAAFAAGLIFAIHPVHTEAVANVVGQNELWAALGALGACLVYANRPAMGVSLLRLLAMLSLYALSVLAKESAAALPALLVLTDFAQRRVPLDRAGLVKYVRTILPLMIAFGTLFAVYLVVRHNVLGTLAGTAAAPGLPHLSEQYRVLNALRAWPEFARLLFFPLDLSADYAPAVIMPVESVTPMVALGAVLVLTVVLLALATPWAPGVGFAAGWFLLTILPVSNFFFPIGVLIAERTLYLPSLAACVLAGLAWDAIARVPRFETRRLASALAVLVVIFFSARTVTRNPDWDSLETVWRGLQRDHPESYRAQWLNAGAMWQRGRVDLAERYFEIAYKLWPRDSQLLTEWGNFYIAQRRYSDAVRLLEKSRDMTPFVPRTYEYLAYAYLHSGRPEDALRTIEQALPLDPQKSIIYPVRATAYEKVGRFAEAADAWRAAVQLKSGNFWLSWAMRARAEASAGRKADALRSADVALTKTVNDSPEATTVTQLKKAIGEGCYPAAGTCDPLRAWQMAVLAPGQAGSGR